MGTAVPPSAGEDPLLCAQALCPDRTRSRSTVRSCGAIALLGALSICCSCSSKSGDTVAGDTAGTTAGGQTTGTADSSGGQTTGSAQTTGGETSGGAASTSQGTGGISDASSPDGAIGGPSTCKSHNYLLCEGFEDTAVGDTPPTGWTRHGNASIADDAAARGAHSMKIAAATNGERRFYYSMASQFGAGHWGRIFYKVQTPVPDPFVHSTMVALYGTGPTVGPAEYRVVDTVKNASSPYHQFLYNVQPSGAEFGNGTAYVYKFDGNWHCAEWHIDGTNQGYDFYYDGQHLQTITIANGAGNYQGSDIPSSFDELRVGWNNYQAADPGFVAWIDEVAIDSNRIGCSD